MSKDEKAAPSKADAIDKFVPSTGDESYITGSKSIVTNKAPLAKNAQLERALPAMADEINAGYADGMMLAQKATKTMIEVGKMLNIARKQFSSDVKFGTWRKKAIDFSQSHVQRLMQVATEFGDVPDAELLPVSTLGVLTNASDKLKTKVITDAKNGKVTTRKDVTEQKKEEKSSDGPPVGDKEVTADSMAKDMEGTDKPEGTPVIEPAEEEWETAQTTLNLPFTTRAKIVQVEGARNPFHAACLVYGIPPFHDGYPSADLVSNLYFVLGEKVMKEDPDNGELLDKLTECHDVLQSVIKLA